MCESLKFTAFTHILHTIWPGNNWYYRHSWQDKLSSVTWLLIYQETWVQCTAGLDFLLLKDLTSDQSNGFWWLFLWEWNWSFTCVLSWGYTPPMHAWCNALALRQIYLQVPKSALFWSTRFPYIFFFILQPPSTCIKIFGWECQKYTHYTAET